MVFLAVKDAGTNVIWGNANEIYFVSSYKNGLNDVSFSIQKTMKMKLFSKKIYCISSQND